MPCDGILLIQGNLPGVILVSYGNPVICMPPVCPVFHTVVTVSIGLILSVLGTLCKLSEPAKDKTLALTLKLK